jgi:calcineurin-like phosphoesterase family protein
MRSRAQWGSLAVATVGVACQCGNADVTLIAGAGPEASEGSSSATPAGESGAATNRSPARKTSAAAPDTVAAARAPAGSLGPLRPAQALDGDCGTGQLTAAGEQAIDRAPYIQNVTTSSATVLFTTRDVAARAQLRLTRPRKLAVLEIPAEVDPSDVTGHQRRALLTDLEPATTYCYELEGWTAPVGFRTAPAAGAGARVRFIAFGDSGGDYRDIVRQKMDSVPFDLMLHAGDIAYQRGALAEFEATFFDTYAGLIARFPIFPASGNHEYGTEAAAPYRQVFALPENGGPGGVERWFSFDWGDIHFVALDTERVGVEQSAWLERDLGATARAWKVVYMHKPPYSSGTHGSSLDVRATFSPSFERFGVQLVISGHDHDYERMKPIAGVTYVVSGGGGFSLRPVGSSDFTAYSASIFHFLHAELEGDTLLLRAIDTSGGVIDSVRIPRVSAP